MSCEAIERLLGPIYAEPPNLVPANQSLHLPIAVHNRNPNFDSQLFWERGYSVTNKIGTGLALWQLQNCDPHNPNHWRASWDNPNREPNHLPVARYGDAPGSPNPGTVYQHPGGLPWPDLIAHGRMFNRREESGVYINWGFQIRSGNIAEWIGLQLGPTARTLYMKQCKNVRPVPGQPISRRTCYHAACAKLLYKNVRPVSGGTPVSIVRFHMTSRVSDANYQRELIGTSLLSVCSNPTDTAQQRLRALDYRICKGCCRPVKVCSYGIHTNRVFHFHREE